MPRSLASLTFAVLVLAAPAFASVATADAQAAPVVADLMKDVDGVQQKLVALAKAMPEDKYAWRPTTARSVGEVFLHVASDNYLIPAMFGSTPPAAACMSASWTTVLTPAMPSSPGSSPRKRSCPLRQTH